MRPIITLAAMLLAAAPLAAAPLTPVETATIDDAVARILASTGVPGASIAVVRDGRIAYAHAYGAAKLTPATPATPAGRMPIASVSKQVTATAILLLAEDGKLSLDDKVSKYLPKVTGGDGITIRQLLSHTSGLRDYWPQDYDFADMAKPVAPAAILARWASAPLDFAPGTQWQYSNTGYVAAGLIIEAVAGEPLMTFLQRRIFHPLGIDVVDADTGRSAGDPLGYHRYALGPVRLAAQPAPGWLFAAGQLAMTASDLARWDIGVIERRVLKPASYAVQQTDVKLAGGSSSHYGLGVDVGAVGDHRMISHGGEATGFLTENRIFPDDRAAVAVEVNADFGNAQGAIADAVDAVLFPDADATRDARMLYDQLRSGTLDRTKLTANANYYFTPTAVADFKASLAPLGEPASFVQSSKKLRGGFTAEVYRVTFPGRTLRVVLRAEPGGGKVEQFMVYPID